MTEPLPVVGLTPLDAVGLEWPTLDEDALLALADRWRRSAGHMSEAVARACDQATTIVKCAQGDTITGFDTRWNGAGAGSPGQREDLTWYGRAAELVATVLDALAAAVVALKTEVLFHLGRLVVSVGSAAAAAVASAGTAAVAVPLLIAAAGVACRKALARFVATARDVAIAKLREARSYMREATNLSFEPNLPMIGLARSKPAWGDKWRDKAMLLATWDDRAWSPKQRELLDKPIRNDEIAWGLSENQTVDLEFEDDSRGKFKPIAGEARGFRAAIPQWGQAKREIATYDLDDEFGFDLVPVTVGRVHPEHGPGSLQAWVEDAEEPSGFISDFSRIDQQKMAVLDYVSANTDRHSGNFLQVDGGSPDAPPKPVAIDNGLAFPMGYEDPIRSDFVAAHLGQELDDEVLDKVRKVDPQHLAERLRTTGLEEEAIEEAVSRLKEIQQHGKITGVAWGGEIVGAIGRR